MKKIADPSIFDGHPLKKMEVDGGVFLREQDIARFGCVIRTIE